MAIFQVRPLDDEHFLEFFECGHDADKLGCWLRDHARKYVSRSQSSVWILGNDGDSQSALGYFTLSSHMISGSDVTKREREGIPKSESHPAQLLGKFAIDASVQAKTAGDSTASTTLMFHVMKVYLEIAALTGTRFLTLHARNKRLEGYYQNQGFSTLRLDTSDEGDTRALMAMSTGRVRSLIE